MKDFVPYNESLELKQLGFDDNCDYAYCEKGGRNKYTGKIEPLTYILRTDGNPFGQYFKGKNWNLDYNPNKNKVKCSALKFSQAFNFFREKDYNSHIEIEEFNLKTYSYKITVLDKYSIGNVFDSYEEAELECLKQLIKIIKNEK